MKANMKKFGKVLAPLAVVMLLVGVAIILLTTMAGASGGQPALDVGIIEPKPDTEIGKSQVFQLTARISNTGNAVAQGVIVRIDPGPYAEVVSPMPSPQGLGDIEPGKEEFVSWMLHCITGTKEGLRTSIEVMAETVQGIIVSDTATIVVTQTAMHPALQVDIVKPPQEFQQYDENGWFKFYGSQRFSVDARIHNFGQEPAYNVQATLSFEVVGEKVGTGDGIRRTFALTYPPIVPGSETIYLDGEPTTAYMLDPETGELVFDEAPDVGVAITADYTCASAELVEGESATKFIGDIPGCETREVEWTVHCTGPGKVKITVIPEGEDDITGDAIENIHPASIDVTQVPREAISVRLLPPVSARGVPTDVVTADVPAKIGTCSRYTIAAVIINIVAGQFKC